VLVLVLTPYIEFIDGEKWMPSKRYFEGVSSVALPIQSTRYLDAVVVLVPTIVIYVY